MNETLLRGARVYSLDDRNTTGDALAIRDGRIQAIST